MPTLTDNAPPTTVPTFLQINPQINLVHSFAARCSAAPSCLALCHSAFLTSSPALNLTNQSQRSRRSLSPVPSPYLHSRAANRFELRFRYVCSSCCHFTSCLLTLHFFVTRIQLQGRQNGGSAVNRMSFVSPEDVEISGMNQRRARRHCTRLAFVG
jgi:hypothetical protein